MGWPEWPGHLSLGLTLRVERGMEGGNKEKGPCAVKRLRVWGTEMQ